MHMYGNNIIHMRDFNVIEKQKKIVCPSEISTIFFTGRTKVEPIIYEIHFPQKQYQFADYTDLQPMIGKMTYLSDVIEMFEYVGQPRQVAATKTLRNYAMKVTFWKE